MTKKLIYAVVALDVLVGSTAYAAGDGMVERGTSQIVFATGVPFVDLFVSDRSARHRFSDINESPIQGKGRINVVHNEPSREAKEFMKSCKPGTTRLLVDQYDNWHCPR